MLRDEEVVTLRIAIVTFGSRDMRSRAAKLGELIRAEDGISQAVEAFQRYYRLDINH